MLLRMLLLVSLFSTPALAERKLFNYDHDGEFTLGNNVWVQTIFADSRPDTLLLLRMANAVSASDQVSDYVLFLDTLVREYRFPNTSFDSLSIVLFNDDVGFVNEMFFSIPIAALQSVNDRDFGSEDLLRHNSGEQVVSLRQMLLNTRITNPQGDQDFGHVYDQLRHTLNEFVFGGAGLVEAIIDAPAQSSVSTGSVSLSDQGGQCQIDWLTVSTSSTSTYQTFSGGCRGEAFAGNWTPSGGYTVTGPGGKTAFGNDRSDVVLRACGCY